MNYCQRFARDMINAKKVALVAMCYLAPSLRYDGKWPDDCQHLDFVNFFWDHKIPMVQVRYCPESEYMHLCAERLPATKNMYNNKKFRKICGDVVRKDILPEVLPLKGQLFYVGVQKSPSCACTITTVGPDMAHSEIVAGRGIFVEELVKILNENNRHITLVDMRFKHRDFSALEKALGL